MRQGLTKRRASALFSRAFQLNSTSTPTLKGVYGQGETEEEAVRDFETALDFTLRAMTEEGEELPASDESARGLPTVDDASRTFRTLAAV